MSLRDILACSKIVPPLAFAAALLLWPARAAAGIVATYRLGFGDRVMMVEVGDRGYGRIEQRLRGPADAEGSYTIVTPEGQNYAVTRGSRLGVSSQPDLWVVYDGRDYQAYLSRRMESRPFSPLSDDRFEEAGEEQVGAWTGTRYVLARTPGTYAQYTELVMLRRPDLAPLGRIFRASFHSSDVASDPGSVRHLFELIANGAPLRIGDYATLESLEFRAIDASRFTLPTPLSREELHRWLDSLPRATEPPRVMTPTGQRD